MRVFLLSGGAVQRPAEPGEAKKKRPANVRVWELLSSLVGAVQLPREQRPAEKLQQAEVGRPEVVRPLAQGRDLGGA